MAQLEVQPRKNNLWWIWVLFTIIALAVLFYFIRSNGRDDANPNLTRGDSTVIRSAGDMATGISPATSAVSFDEITDTNIDVKGDQQGATYSLDETLLFDTEKSSVRSNAVPQLKQITQSVQQRYQNGNVVIRGYTDSRGSKGYNKELAEQRADAVKKWMITEGGLKEEQISINPIGEASPTASNQTEEGRQENRRVEIVVKNTQ
jgi:outer membrane protein OmpA-like peptidoglycan-associated protein